jgi:hypothetical protein
MHITVALTAKSFGAFCFNRIDVLTDGNAVLQTKKEGDQTSKQLSTN